MLQRNVAKNINMECSVGWILTSQNFNISIIKIETIDYEGTVYIRTVSRGTVERCTSWGPIAVQLRKEIIRLLWNLEVHYDIHNRMPMGHIVSKKKATHIVTLCFSLRLMLILFSSLCLFYGFPDLNFIWISYLCMHATFYFLPIVLDLITITILSRMLVTRQVINGFTGLMNRFIGHHQVDLQIFITLQTVAGTVIH